jgi:hypothetical protein
VAPSVILEEDGALSNWQVDTYYAAIVAFQLKLNLLARGILLSRHLGIL